MKTEQSKGVMEWWSIESHHSNTPSLRSSRSSPNMNEKLKQLFEAARREPAPAPGDAFEASVMRSIRRETPAGPASLFDQLGLLFPRLAFAAVMLIAVCVAGEFLSSALSLPSLSEGVAQLSDQWLFTVNGI